MGGSTLGSGSISGLGGLSMLGKPMATNNFVTKLYQYVHPFLPARVHVPVAFWCCFRVLATWREQSKTQC
jgi:hypothetical protein